MQQEYRYISLFSGGGGADIGVMQAGFTPVAANEYDPAIAEVYAQNIGPHVRVGDILEQDPHDYPPCDLLHASPPCPSFSVAKNGAHETPHDIALADKITKFIEALHPRWFTLENVMGYRKSQSFALITAQLTRMGYFWDWEICNSADFGVPQTRRRLVLRACIGGLLRPLPAPVPWVGWYEAIEDLIPTLPESHFAEWQLKRLPEELCQSTLLNNHFAEPEGNMVNNRGPDEPAQIVTVFERRPMRAFIVGSDSHEEVGGRKPITKRDCNEPSLVITQSAGKMRAFIVGGANTSDEQAAPGVGVSELDEPTRCVQQSARQWKAFVYDGFNLSSSRPRMDQEPSSTVDAMRLTKHPRVAFIVDGQNSGTPNNEGERGLTIRQQGQPMHTVSATQTRRSIRAWLSQGRVVAMTPRCLARFQSFPDQYALPANNSLACRVIGNACPPLMMEKIYKNLCSA